MIAKFINKNLIGLIVIVTIIQSIPLQAIKETNNNLVAALDRFDSVGRIDSYFPNADFFVAVAIVFQSRVHNEVQQIFICEI